MRLCEIVGRDGRRRTVDLDDPMNEPLRDGERLHVPTMFADTAGDLFISSPDAADDFTVTDADRRRVIDARNEYIDRLTTAWRGGPSRPLPIADGADPYEAYVHRLQNAWRGER